MSTEQDTQLKEVFDEQIAAGVTDKTTIAIAMHNATACGINVAIATYNKLGKAAGVVLSTEDRNAKISETLATFAGEEGFNREGASAGLIADFGMTKSTATNHIRAYCTANGIELPKADTAKVAPAVIDETVKTMHGEGKSRTNIVDAIVTEHGYSKNTASSVLSKSLKRLSLTIAGGRSSESRAKLMQYFIQNGDKYERKDIIAGLVEHFGLSPATAVTYYGNYQFALSYVHELNNPTAEVVAEEEVAA